MSKVQTVVTASPVSVKYALSQYAFWLVRGLGRRAILVRIDSGYVDHSALVLDTYSDVAIAAAKVASKKGWKKIMVYRWIDSRAFTHYTNAAGYSNIMAVRPVPAFMLCEDKKPYHRVIRATTVGEV
jgi:hypothetical protein